MEKTAEKMYKDTIKRQLAIISALGKDYLNLCLVNVKSGMATPLNLKLNGPIHEMGENFELPYDEMCRQSIEKYAAGNKEELLEKVKLENVANELREKQEYNFEFEALMNGVKQDCQMKYFSMEDEDHIFMGFRFIDEMAAREKEQKQAVIKRSAEELRKERLFLEVLSRNYTSVYYFDVENDAVEILKLDANANAGTMVGTALRDKLDYTAEMRRYCAVYVVPEERDEFLCAMNRKHIQERLSRSDHYAFRYQSNPNKAGHCHFEAQVVRLNSLDENFDGRAILAFCHIDELIEAEKRRQQELKTAIEIEERTKRLEKERKAAVEANEMKSRFLSSISHDIRTPINGIQGMLKIADTYPNDMKKQSECREKMWIASNYLVSLVNNVLNLNRLENKSIDLTEQPFNLIKLLMDLSAMADMQARAQGLKSVVDWKPDYIKHRYLIGSAEGLSRIIMNLTSNAIKYNKKGGTIYGRCVEKKQYGDTIWFEFVNEDTGIGMDEDFLNRAFDAYAQEKNTSLNSINGVGLGLSIVKQTVDLMGGTIEVESKVNEGTRYRIMLPFQVDPDPHTVEEEVPQISLKGIKALLVEDNELNLEIAKFHLEQEDVKVFTAVNGQEAVEMFQESEVGYYDIILMDIQMPIMNGLDATRAIRKMDRPDALAIPIIAMSANAFEEDIELSLKAGLNAYLVKPLDGKKVADTMKKYLANRIIKE